MIVNGKEITLEKNITLAEYLESVGCDAASVAVGVNDVIVPRSSFATQTLQNGDTIEIVRIVGGG